MTENIYNTPAYKIARSVYIAIGGDPNKNFDSVEDIYSDIDSIFDVNTGRVTVEPLNLNITENGSHYIDNQDITGYKPVSVDVNIPSGLVIDVDSIGYSDDVADIIYDAERATIALSKKFKDTWSSGNTQLSSSGIKYVPALSDVSNVTSISLDNSTVCFGDAVFSKYTSTLKPFQTKSALAYVGNVSFPGVTSTENYFQNCVSLVKIGSFSAEKSTGTNYMFSGCSKLKEIGNIYLPNANRLYYTFSNCTALETIDNLTVSENLNYMYYAFSYCSSLKEFPNLNTSNVTEMGGMCNNCSALETVPLLDCSKLMRCTSMFDYCSSLKHLGGFKDLGKGGLYNDLNFYSSRELTHESMLNIVNNLYDLAANNMSSVTIKFHWDALNRLTAEEKAIATNKGWVLTS